MAKDKGARSFQNARLRKQQDKEAREAGEMFPRALELFQRGRPADAQALCRKILQKAPRNFNALLLLGIAQYQAGSFEEADRLLAGALSVDPRSASAHANRAAVLLELKRFNEAVASCDRAIAIEPSFAEAYANRGNALLSLGRCDEALASFDKALAMRPGVAGFWVGRGNVFLQQDRFAEATVAFHKALAIEPRSVIGLTQLAQAYEKQGNTGEAIACYDRALAIDPDFGAALSNRIFTLDFVPTAGFAEQQEARREWWRRAGAKAAAGRRFEHANSADPARRVVLGYVSADFRAHSASAAFKPILLNHDKREFRVILYSASVGEDAVTREFKQAADAWREVAGISDEALAEQVVADGVDILIDLSGHTLGHRLRVFAMKPAPVQVTAWGHASGNGMPTIDYLFADPVSIPPEVRHLFAETLCDLPCFITIEPPPAEHRNARLPALSQGHVTFGVFNRLSKISDDAIQVWSRILQAAPRSRLLVKSMGLGDESTRAMLRARFERQGVAADRLGFLGPTPHEEHLRAHSMIDISLDTFPQNGGVSTWESLHMGVPVVATLGNGRASRVSAAILASIGLSDWVAKTADEYVAVALRRAADLDGLAALRRGLPAMIASSLAGNPRSYLRAVETAYRSMWQAYCAGRAA